MSNHGFLIIIRNNIVSVMHGFRDTEVFLFLRKGALHAILYDGFIMRNHDFLIAFHNNFLSGMHSFRDNEVLLPSGYDVIDSPPPGGASGNFS